MSSPNNETASSESSTREETKIECSENMSYTTWSDIVYDLFSTLSRYYPGYAAFEHGLEWESPEEKEDREKNEAEADKQGKK